MDPGPGVPLPQVSVEHPLASQVADLAAIADDFKTVVESINAAEIRIADGADPDNLVARALWESAAIAYRRAFTGGKALLADSASRLRLPNDWVEAAGGPAGRSTHEQAMTLANQHIAHRVNDAHQARVLIFLNPPPEARGVAGCAVFSLTLQYPNELAPALAQLAVGLLHIVETEHERGRDMILEWAKKVPIDDLYNASSSGPTDQDPNGSGPE